MPGQIFRLLSNVEHTASVELPRPGQRDTDDLVTGRRPGVHAAAEFANDVVITNLCGLPCYLGRILVWVTHNDQWPVWRRQPAQPAGEHLPQRNRNGAA